MQKPRLGILVASIKTRENFLKRLLERLEPQVNAAGDDVRFFVLIDNGEVSIGEKRNQLLDLAIAAGVEYICYIDDDDLVPEYYVAKILETLRENPQTDCVGFRVARYVEGQLLAEARHSIQYQRYTVLTKHNKIAGFERTPNHLNPIKLSLVVEGHIRFPHQDMGEDVCYARKIRPLLKTEAWIDDIMYMYYHRAHRPGEVTHRHKKSH